MIGNLNNLIILVQDLKRMTEFYRDILGPKPIPNPKDVSSLIAARADLRFIAWYAIAAVLPVAPSNSGFLRRISLRLARR